tara:strand:+ start:163 stop:588 length:426 start_codon:yes stop_codon:yes gene_type:complete
MASTYTELRKEYPRTWRIWYIMNNRIKNNISGYQDTEICEEWDRRLCGQAAFLQFLEDMGPCEKDGLELARHNCCNGFYLDNVAWMPRENRLLRTKWAQTPNGAMYIKIKQLGYSYMNIYTRMKSGRSLEEIYKEAIKNVK